MKKLLFIIVSVLSFDIPFSQGKIKSSDKVSLTKEGIFATTEKIIEIPVSEFNNPAKVGSIIIAQVSTLRRIRIEKLLYPVYSRAGIIL